MLKRILTLCLCCFIAFCSIIPVFASSTFSSSIPDFESFIDVADYKHDYFAIWGNDGTGYLIEVVYYRYRWYCVFNVGSSLLVNFYCSDPGNTSYKFYVNVRDLSSGSLDRVYSYSSGTTENNFNITIGDVSVSSMNFYSLSKIGFSRISNSSSILPGTVNYLVSSSEGVIFTPLSEPVADAVNKYLVFSNGSQGVILMFSDFSEGALSLSFFVDSNGSYFVVFDNNASTSSSCTLTLFNLTTGFMGFSYRYVIAANSVETKRLSANYLQYPYVGYYGISFDSLPQYPISLPSINWNSDYFLSYSIASNTLILWNQLVSINQRLLSLDSSIIDGFDSVNSNLFHLITLLDQFYNSSSSFQPTQPSFDAIQDYDNLESSIFNNLNNNLDSNLNSVFDSSNIVGNNAFAFIRSMLQIAVLDNSKLNSFVFFGLTIGLAVMIIGRKVND